MKDRSASRTREEIGLSEADRERLFQLFERVGLSQALVPGVGLGLFAVRRIVEAHIGRIAVESKLGAGSTFRVHLPRAAMGALTGAALLH